MNYISFNREKQKDEFKKLKKARLCSELFYSQIT